MIDIFSPKTIPLTPELGMALKSFRIAHNITAKKITEKFERASSYISKLEKGDIKKVEATFFMELCNYISNSDNGISNLLEKLAPNYTDYSNETKFIILNIDDLLVGHSVPQSLITEINEYKQTHNITINQLVDKINENKDISDIDNYDSLPQNQWYSSDNDIDHAVIKLFIPQTYIENLLNGKILTIHRVILKAILYSLYKLGKEENPHLESDNKLTIFNINPIRRVIKITDENIDTVLGGLEPDAAEAFNKVTAGLKLITTITKGYGVKRIKSISNNMKEDLGFYFAYMAVDLTELEKANKDKKQVFLDELKALVDKYSKNEDTGLDLYE